MNRFLKKAACLGAAACLCFGAASASDVDLTGMSFDELVALRERVTVAMMSTDAWQEVRVPAGVYKVGVEIPAGRWTIRPIDGETAFVYFGTKLNDLGTELVSPRTFETISSPTASYYKYNKVESVTWTLKEGQYFIATDSPVIFTPYTGPSFSFK